MVDYFSFIDVEVLISKTLFLQQTVEETVLIVNVIDNLANIR